MHSEVLSKCTKFIAKCPATPPLLRPSTQIYCEKQTTGGKLSFSVVILSEAIYRVNNILGKERDPDCK